MIALLHGLIGTLDEAAIVGAFGEHVVHAPALIGYGAGEANAPPSWTLDDQADHVAEILRDRHASSVHVVGHSVGGAVGAILAARHPELVRSLCSVEGNMTLDDAFWSAEISRHPLDKLERMLDDYRMDVDGWLTAAGVVPTTWTRKVATAWLDAQPAATLRNQASAVVKATGEPSYLLTLERLLTEGLPLHLVAGERSVGGWHVPERIRSRARSLTVIPNTGHLMMLESPDAFARAVISSTVGDP